MLDKLFEGEQAAELSRQPWRIVHAFNPEGTLTELKMKYFFETEGYGVVLTDMKRSFFAKAPAKEIRKSLGTFCPNLDISGTALCTLLRKNLEKAIPSQLTIAKLRQERRPTGQVNQEAKKSEVKFAISTPSPEQLTLSLDMNLQLAGKSSALLPFHWEIPCTDISQDRAFQGAFGDPAQAPHLATMELIDRYMVQPMVGVGHALALENEMLRQKLVSNETQLRALRERNGIVSNDKFHPDAFERDLLSSPQLSNALRRATLCLSHTNHLEDLFIQSIDLLLLEEVNLSGVGASAMSRLQARMAGVSQTPSATPHSRPPTTAGSAVPPSMAVTPVKERERERERETEGRPSPPRQQPPVVESRKVDAVMGLGADIAGLADRDGDAAALAHDGPFFESKSEQERRRQLDDDLRKKAEKERTKQKKIKKALM